MTAASPFVEPETPADAEAIDRLVLAAFGPGRFAKTAERLREACLLVQGFVIREQGAVVGSVRLWPIRIEGVAAVFLGPIAVDAGTRRSGLGAALVEACLNWADERGVGVLLVGDPPYFSRFGFTAAPDVRLPGPVDPRRVMWRGGEPAPVGTARPGC